jgi:hypothetical protein
MRDRKYIISLERGLKILEIFGESARRLTLTEVDLPVRSTKPQRSVFCIRCAHWDI